MIICKQPRIGGVGESAGLSIARLLRDDCSPLSQRFDVLVYRPSQCCWCLDRIRRLYYYKWLPGTSSFGVVLKQTTYPGRTLLTVPFQSFLPGSHRLARVSSRFVKDPKGHGTTFEAVPGVEPNEEKWDETPGWKEAPCPAGTLVLIHGELSLLTTTHT